MKSYLTLADSTAEIIVQRSRFIAYICSIADEDNARDKLNAIRKKHYDATHVCYAYIADEAGNVSKTSDDGEPSGTAGAPILAVIAKFRKVMAVVVRYFGGTKLGVGGLVKAYSDAAAAAVSELSAIEYTESNVYQISFSYTEFERARKTLTRSKMLDTEYNDCVKCLIAVPSEYDIVKELTELLGHDPCALLIEKSRYINY